MGARQAQATSSESRLLHSSSSKMHRGSHLDGHLSPPLIGQRQRLHHGPPCGREREGCALALSEYIYIYLVLQSTDICSITKRQESESYSVRPTTTHPLLSAHRLRLVSDPHSLSLRLSSRPYRHGPPSPSPQHSFATTILLLGVLVSSMIHCDAQDIMSAFSAVESLSSIRGSHSPVDNPEDELRRKGTSSPGSSN